jgi:hypothetical protein
MRTVPVSVRLIAIVKNSSGQRVANQIVRWRVNEPLPPNSIPWFGGYVFPDITDACGVGNTVPSPPFLEWIDGVANESVTIIAEALDDLGNVIGTPGSYTNTLTLPTCTAVDPPYNQTNVDLVKTQGPCNLTYTYDASQNMHMLSHVRAARDRWHNRTNHVKFIETSSSDAFITFKEVCPSNVDAPNAEVCRNNTADCMGPNPPPGKIFIYLNKYHMYGHCEGQLYENCPYDWPIDDSAIICIIANELGHALGYTHVQTSNGRKNLMHYLLSWRWYRCATDAPDNDKEINGMNGVNALYTGT